MNKEKYTETQNSSLLKQQVLLENKVFSVRDDRYIHLFTLLCSQCYNKEELQTQIKSIHDSIDFSTCDISMTKELAILYYLYIKNNFTVSKQLEECVNSLCIEAIGISQFPLGQRAIIAYFLKKSNLNTIQLNSKIDEIKIESIGLLETGNIPAAIDGLFAVDNIDERYIDILVSNAKNNYLEIGREKVAKLAIELKIWESSKADSFIFCLEAIIENDFECWIIPDIQFALIESEKLVNSNLPCDITNEILTTLKKSGNMWAQSINEILENGVIVDLKTYNRMPAFSPIEDVLSLIALIEYNITQKYELEPEEYAYYKKIKEIESEGKIASLLGGINLSIIILFIGISITLNIVLRWNELTKAYQYIANILHNSPKFSDIQSLIKNPYSDNIFPITINVLLIIWIYRMISFYIQKRTLKIINALKIAPIIGFILKKIKGDT